MKALLPTPVHYRGKFFLNAKKLLLVNKKDSLKYKTSDYPLANNSNFDRNRVRGVQLRFGGGCSSRFEGVHYSTREDSNKPQALKPAVFSFFLGLKPRFLCRPGI